MDSLSASFGIGSAPVSGIFGVNNLSQVVVEGQQGYSLVASGLGDFFNGFSDTLLGLNSALNSAYGAVQVGEGLGTVPPGGGEIPLNNNPFGIPMGNLGTTLPGLGTAPGIEGIPSFLLNSSFRMEMPEAFKESLGQQDFGGDQNIFNFVGTQNTTQINQLYQQAIKEKQEKKAVQAGPKLKAPEGLGITDAEWTRMNQNLHNGEIRVYGHVKYDKYRNKKRMPPGAPPLKDYKNLIIEGNKFNDSYSRAAAWLEYEEIQAGKKDDYEGKYNGVLLGVREWYEPK
ncbi:MAG: hypothetical protein J7M18_02865 [Candidatus Eremiobacteraeota bacterium]|nr:hypothetical protein [Candidatus Eremiobacteraeota bacterium]